MNRKRTFKVTPGIQRKMKELQMLEQNGLKFSGVLNKFGKGEGNMQYMRQVYGELQDHYQKKENVLQQLDQLLGTNSKAHSKMVSEQKMGKFRPGDRVCAYTQAENGRGGNWILGSVVKTSSNGYVVKDIESTPPAEGERQKQYNVKRGRVLFVPKNWEDRYQARVGEKVLAIYPETTVFYAARIVSVPRQQSDIFFSLKFDDDVDPVNGITPSRQTPYDGVIEFPKM